MREITYKIERFDGEKTFVQEYKFPHQPGKTILWGLIHIKENLDATLKFTAACRSAVCGACAVRVNGQAYLACETPLDFLLDRYKSDTLFIQPLGNFKVIRDLVVDWEPKAERLAEVKPYLVPKDEFTAEKGCRQSPADFKKIDDQAGCILCGACASECTKLSANDKDFYDPFIFAKAEKFVVDSRDKAAAERIKIVMEKGLWKCMHCVECVTKCPKGVAPGERIAKLRQLSMKMGYADNAGARHAVAFLRDIEDTGRLNEMKLSLRSDGLLKSMTKMPLAFRLFTHGKLNPLHFPGKVKGHDQVRAILKAVKEAEE